MSDSDFIPMVDLRTQYHNLKEEIDSAVHGVLESCAFILGPNVQAFENEIATFLHAKHAVSCASGTDALHLALRALELQPGDEVITPSFTFAATAEAIVYTGATPVFVDIDPHSFNLDPDRVEKMITPRTRAIIAVHLYGHPAKIQTLARICDQHKLYLIEDCAQSFGATVDRQPTGSFGIMGCFSFFPSKNLGAYGDGGLISTNDTRLSEKLKALRNHGSQVRYQHDQIGFNSRLDELQAAILRIKLKYIDEWNQRRRQVARNYSRLLEHADITTPSEQTGCYHVYHQYTILTYARERIQKALTKSRIAHAIYYPAGLHQQKAFFTSEQAPTLPVTEDTCKHCLSLPIYPELTLPSIERICRVILDAI